MVSNFINTHRWTGLVKKRDQLLFKMEVKKIKNFYKLVLQAYDS